MVKYCGVFYFKKLYSVYFLDYIWIWIFYEKRILKFQDWILIVKYDSPLISGPESEFSNHCLMD